MQQPTFADFESYPPHDHGVVIDDVSGAEFRGDHHTIRPGGQVVLGGFAVTRTPRTQLVLVLRGRPTAPARSVRVVLSVNGEQLAHIETVPEDGGGAVPGSVAGVTDIEVPLPSDLLRPAGERDVLKLSVDPDADGSYCLTCILVDAADERGQSESARRDIAEAGTLSVFATHRGAPGRETVEGVLWLRVKAIGRAGLASVAWRLGDGEHAEIAFDRRQLSFVGHRVRREGEPESYVGKAAGIMRLERKAPRASRDLTFESQLLEEDSWQDAAVVNLHLDVDDGNSPLAGLSWTDWSGARSAIAFTPDGTAFFGHLQRPGHDPVAYRGRRVGATRPFPFEPMPEAAPKPAPDPTPHTEPNPADTKSGPVRETGPCPSRLLSGGPSEPGAVIAAAREALGRGDSPQRVGEAVRHLLTHGFLLRPEVARAIVELTPDQRATAAAQLSGYLAQPSTDPAAKRAHYQETPPSDYERLCTAVALAVLDRAHLELADRAYETAQDYAAACLGADYGLLGPAARGQSLQRLRHLAASGTFAVAEGAVRSMLRLEAYEDVNAAVHACVQRGMYFSRLMRPLVSAAPTVLPALVDSELHALAATPEYLLAHRGPGSENLNSVADAAAQILACGPAYRGRVVQVLWELVDSSRFGHDIRWRAADQLALVTEPEHARAVAALREAGVEDPRAPRAPKYERTEEDLRSAQDALAAVWRRIERELAARFPEFPVSFGAPAGMADVEACETALGVRLPAEFVASCLIHRDIGFGDAVAGMPTQLSLEKIVEVMTTYLGGEWSNDRAPNPDVAYREDSGWRDGWIPVELEGGTEYALDLDPAPAGRYGQVIALDNQVPFGVQAPGWLALLERFAENLEADRYFQSEYDHGVFLDLRN